MGFEPRTSPPACFSKKEYQLALGVPFINWARLSGPYSRDRFTAVASKLSGTQTRLSQSLCALKEFAAHLIGLQSTPLYGAQLLESAPGAPELIYHPGPNYFYFLQVEILPSEGAYRDVRDVIGNNFRPTLDDLKSGRRVGHRSLYFKVLGSTLALASLRGGLYNIACISSIRKAGV